MASKAEYQKYLQSPSWQTTRTRRLKLAGGQCEFRPYHEAHKSWFGDRCTETNGLEVHHQHYRTLGAERDEDLEVLCRVHHLVHTIKQLECEYCGEFIFQHEDDARELVEATVEYCEIKDLTLDMVDPPGCCDYCDHILNDD